MKHTDLPENIFEKDKVLLMGQSELVKVSVIKDFLIKSCDNTKIVYLIALSDAFNKRLLDISKELEIQLVIYNKNIQILNAFELSDWYYLIEHFQEGIKIEEIKNYLRFLFELRKIMPEKECFLEFYKHFCTVKSAMDFLKTIKIKNIINIEEYDNYKIQYLETMNGAIGLEEIINEVNLITVGYIATKRQKELFWCLIRKVISLLDNSIPIIINYAEEELIDGVKELMSGLTNKKILFIADDIVKGCSDNSNFISHFDVSIFSRIRYMPSAKLIENIFGTIKKPKMTYSETYDRRIGNNRWIDKVFHTNKTETYVTGYEYEPLFSKEEISNMDNEIALFIYELERGYMQCIQG